MIDDRLIALRKGVRSCTSHLLYNFVSWKGLSLQLHAFVSNLYSDAEDNPGGHEHPILEDNDFRRNEGCKEKWYLRTYRTI